MVVTSGQVQKKKNNNNNNFSHICMLAYKRKIHIAILVITVGDFFSAEWRKNNVCSLEAKLRLGGLVLFFPLSSSPTPKENH